MSEDNWPGVRGMMQKSERILTINRAGMLSDLIRGVEQNAKLVWYPIGSDTDKPMVQILRAFTYAEGALYPHNADIRDAHVWTSGFTEHWFPVSDVLDAFENINDGSHGMDKPMARIDFGP